MSEQNTSRRGAALLTLFVAILDCLCFVLALYISYHLWVAFPWHGNYQPFEKFKPVIWALPLLAVIVFKSVGLYKPEMGVIGVEEQTLIFKSIWIVYFVIFAISFFYRDTYPSRLAVFYSIGIAILILSLERYWVRKFYQWLHAHGGLTQKALIYGAGFHGQRLERWISESPKLGISVAGYLDDDVQRLLKKPKNPAWLGGISEFEKIASIHHISVLFIAHRKLEEEKIVEIFQRCRDLKIKCWAIPSLYQFHVERAEFSNIGGIPLMSFRQGFAWRSYASVKRVLDLFSSIPLAVFFLPLCGLIALMIKTTSHGPVLFKQARVGFQNKRFFMYKFRTLKSSHKKDEISPELSSHKAQYIPMGIFLRKTGLDELPQLWNVIRGDMSIVGPRPEMPFIVEKYGPLERERLVIKPGVTGLWQISSDRKRLLIHENMDYDLYYVEHQSFNLDLAILLKTLFVQVKRFLE